MNITPLQIFQSFGRSPISRLRRDLAAYLTRYQDLRADVSCGVAMHKEMSVEFSTLCDALNKTLDELAKLDPTTPRMRF